MIGERNLAPEKGPSVWDRAELTGEGAGRRWVQGLGGAAMAAAGVALVAVGGTRVFRALASGAVPASFHPADHGSDEVGFESNQSFPASDAPSWTPVHGVSPRNEVG